MWRRYPGSGRGGYLHRQNNLPAPENIQVPEAASHGILKYEFVHNGLWHRRIDQYRKSKIELPTIIVGGIDIIPTCLNILELFIPKAFIKEVVIPQKKKTWWRGYMCLPIVSYWCGPVCGSWWQPFKVFRAMIFGSKEKLIPLIRIHTTSTTNFPGPDFRIF